MKTLFLACLLGALGACASTPRQPAVFQTTMRYTGIVCIREDTARALGEEFAAHGTSAFAERTVQALQENSCYFRDQYYLGESFPTYVVDTWTHGTSLLVLTRSVVRLSRGVVMIYGYYTDETI
jgi:hypothetical protein